MGRPIKKRFFGATNDPAAGAGTESGFNTNAGSFGITILAYIPGGSSAVTSIINRQVGANKYVVSNVQGSGRVILTDDSSPGEGYGYLVGYLAQNPDTVVPIKKLTARRALGFDDTVYHWEAQNDSTQDLIVLTAI